MRQQNRNGSTLLSIRVCYDGWMSGNRSLQPLGLLSLDQLLPITKMVVARHAFEIIELFKKCFLVRPQIDLETPRTTVLLNEVPISVGNSLRLQQRFFRARAVSLAHLRRL